MRIMIEIKAAIPPSVESSILTAIQKLLEITCREEVITVKKIPYYFKLVKQSPEELQKK